MRQAYDYWQDQPGTYHRRRARAPGPARQGAGPNARSRAPRPGLTPGPLALRRQARGLSPVQAASDARARLPAPRRSVPQAGPGAERAETPGRVSPRLRGACLRPARGPSCPCGVAPEGAHSPAPGLRRPQPRPGPGGFRRPGASPRPSEERASGRAGGRAAHAGWPPRALAHQPPACAVLAWPDRVPASFWLTRSERRRLHASSRGAPLGTVRLRTATRTKACDLSATASALPPRRPPPRKDTSRLRGGHRSPHAPGPSRRDGAPAPGYGRPTARRRPGLGSIGVRSWRPGRRQRPCHRALCVLTRRGCPILYVPAQCAPAKTEALLPSRFREGRRDLLPSQNGRGGERPPPPPLPFSGGEERRARRPRAGARPRRARSGAPACDGLRQSPTPAAGASSTSAGLSGAPAGGGQWWSPDPRSRRAFDLGRPERGARTCQAAAVTQPLRRACSRPWPARHPCRRGPARRSPRGPSAAGRDRRNLKLARRTGRWPAEASAGPRRRRPCPLFTLLLILLTTPS